MNKYDLADSRAVRDLAALQEGLRLNDDDFVRRVKLSYSGSSWGKVKAATYSGNCRNVLAAVERAQANYSDTQKQLVIWAEGSVVLEHMEMARNAVEIARGASDEHKLVVVCGLPGSGKTQTGRYLREQFGGTLLHARPSWARSYLQTLKELARGLDITGKWRSAGGAERAILTALTLAPRLIIIDEANHFSRDALNFLKTILNETNCALVLLTLPTHLAAMAAELAEETQQLLRRAVAIVHIPQVGIDDITAMHKLYPAVDYSGLSLSICTAANRLCRLDTVDRILSLMETGKDEAAAIREIDNQTKAVIK